MEQRRWTIRSMSLTRSLSEARARERTRTHTQPTTSRSRNAATYLPNFPLPKPPVWGGGDNSALTQPFPCEHKRPHHMHKVLISFAKETLLDAQRSSFGWLRETAKAWKILKHGMFVICRNELRLALLPLNSVQSLTPFSAPSPISFILWCSQYVTLHCTVLLVRLLAHYEICTASALPPFCNSPLQMQPHPFGKFTL